MRRFACADTQTAPYSPRTREIFQTRKGPAMTKALISYDDTLNDHDALALGRVLGDAGAELVLAYVRHTTQAQRSREELEEHEAQALLERGARWLDDLDVERRVVVSASTGQGLRWLAEHEAADIVVFGSDYRTPARRVSPQHSAQALLDGGPAAVAIAPANFRAQREARIERIGVLVRGRRRLRADHGHRLGRPPRGPADHRRVPLRPARRRLAARGTGRPGHDHRASAERDRERPPACPRGGPRHRPGLPRAARHRLSQRPRQPM